MHLLIGSFKDWINKSNMQKVVGQSPTLVRLVFSTSSRVYSEYQVLQIDNIRWEGQNPKLYSKCIQCIDGKTEQGISDHRFVDKA